MPSLNDRTFNLLVNKGRRLPGLVRWLQEEVWTETRMKTLGAEKYLRDGERKVYELEELISRAAPGIWDELAADSLHQGNLLAAFSDPAGATQSKSLALVIFDGLSLREVPRILELATRSYFQIVCNTYSLAALPSETTDFVQQRVLGKKLSPAQLADRTEVAEKRISFYYFEEKNRQYALGQKAGPLLLWSAFPDNTYKNDTSRFPEHFATVNELLATAWRNTIQQVPHPYEIVVTSDHGYLYFDPAATSTRSDRAATMLDHRRHRFYAPNEPLPEHPDLQIVGQYRLALLRGRIKNRIKGEAGNRLYRHGGLSLMEMIVPWIALKFQGAEK